MMEQNPYAAPRAAVADRTPEERKRPVLIWVITIFMAFGIVGSILSSVAALSGSPIGGQAAADYLTSVGIGPLDHVWTLLVTAISIFAFVDLFRLKRRALPLLAALFAIGLAYSTVKLAINPAYRALFDNAPSLWSVLAGWAVNLAIIGYVWWLRRKGVLR